VEISDWELGAGVGVSLQAESRPARSPARPREAILMRRRFVRDLGRKAMS
jgi:hypothetical protein